MVRNPVTTILFVIFFIINIVDLVTAYFILPGESNPLYLLTGSYWSLIFIKIFFIFLVWIYYYKNIYQSNFMHYFFIALLIFSSFVGLIAIINNSIGIANPELLRVASETSTTEKLNGYGLLLGIIFYLPMLLCIFIFILYEKSCKYCKIKKIRDREYFKLRR